MPSFSRALPIAAMLVMLTACGFRPAPNQFARDAQLIVSSVTPVAQRVSSYGASPATAAAVAGSLGSTTGDAAVLTEEGIPGLLEMQNFFQAAQSLLATLATVGGLPPEEAGVVQAAIALLPPYAATVNSPLAVVPRMSPAQARLILAGSGAPSDAVARSAPPVTTTTAPAAVSAGPSAAELARPRSRFQLSMDEVDGQYVYRFLDGGAVIETGTAPNFRALESRYAAFRTRRLSQSP